MVASLTFVNSEPVQKYSRMSRDRPPAINMSVSARAQCERKLDIPLGALTPTICCRGVFHVQEKALDD